MLRVVFEAPPPQQQSHREGRYAKGPAVDQLSFLDLLYAVPVGDLAMRVSGAELSRVSSADWSALAMIMATIVLSWIGLHKNRAAMADESDPRRPIGLIPFWSLRLVQFLIEIFIIGIYFAMGLFLKLPTESDHTVGTPAEDWLTGFLLVIFLLYLAWDWADVRLATSRKWRETASDGRIVTAKSLVPMGVIFLVALFTRPRTVAPVVALNILLVILLYSFRFAQDRWGNTPPE